MSLYFLANNLHFALELMGAVALLMAAWLTFDTYTLKKDALTLFRVVGFGLFAFFQVIHAVHLGGDISAYLGSIVFLAALGCILGSFVKTEELHVQAVIVLPAFTLWSGYLSAAAAVFLLGIAYCIWRKSKKEMNATWMPLSVSFVALGLGAVIGIWVKGNDGSVLFIVEHLFKLVGFIFLIRWVWQYLALRIRESLVLIFISAALFLSTVVTLAFSTILIGEITTQTQNNLLTDARVLNLTVEGLKEESVAKATLIAQSEVLKDALEENDFSELEELTEGFMETYNLGFITVVDKDGSVLVRAHALSRRGDSLFGERAVEEALQGNVFVTVETSPVEKLSIRAGAPLTSGRFVIGAVIAGYPLDNALVDRIKRVTGLEMFMYEKDISTAATALAADGRTRLTGIPVANSDVESAVLGEGKTVTARTDFYGAPYHASYLPLLNGDGKIVGMISAAKPEQDILDIADATNRLTLITVIGIMLILTYPIYLFTRRLTSES